MADLPEGFKVVVGLPEGFSVVEEGGGTILNAVSQGQTLGHTDEISGLIGAAMRAFTSMPNTPSSITRHGVAPQGFNPQLHNKQLRHVEQDLKDTYFGVRDQVRSDSDAYAARNPGTALAAEVGGGLLTGGLGAAKSIGGATGKELIKESTKIGGLLGGVSGGGYSDAETLPEYALDVGAGTGIGLMSGFGFPALGQSFAKIRSGAKEAAAPSANYQQAVNLLQNDGLQLTGGQVRASNWQRVVEEQLADTMIVGTPLQRTLESQRKEFQKGLLRRLKADEGDGLIDLDKADDVLNDLSAQYGKALGGKKIDLADDAFIDDLAEIEAKHSDLVDDVTARKVENIIDKFLKKAIDEHMQSGEWYQKQRSLFAKRARKNLDTSEMYGDLVGALDDAFERVAPTAKGDIDRRWSQGLQLQRAAKKGGAEVSEGFLPLASLNNLAKSSPGTQDWRSYVNAGAMVLPARVGNSGTAARQHAQAFINNPFGTVNNAVLTGAGFANLPATIGGGLALRGLAARQAAGMPIDATSLLPSGSLLARPEAAGSAALAGLLQPNNRGRTTQ